MTQPAEITSAADWSQLVGNIRLFVDDVDALYKRITAGPAETDETKKEKEKEQPVPDPDNHPDLIDDPDQQALDEQERLDRIKAEIDGEPDGDYENEPADYGDPSMEA
jgi:hypothetical protein